MEHGVVFSSDLHGNATQYRKLVQYAQETGARSLILGGDLTPKDRVRGTIQGQRDFLKREFPQFFEPLKAERPEVGVYVILGNDDNAVNMDVLKKSDPKLYHVIHGVRARLNETFEIIGYPYVPITHVGLKDWEKFDVAEYPERFRQAETDKKGEWELSGAKSVRRNRWNQWPPFAPSFGYQHLLLNPADAAHDSIETDLANPVFTERANKTVYVMHCPPYGTHLDHSREGYQIGSVAERLFIERHQPYLTLHGHVHQTVKRSGDFREKIGDTISLCSGNRPYGENLALVTFDLAHPEAAERSVI